MGHGEVSAGTPLLNRECWSRPGIFAKPAATRKQSARGIARGSQWIRIQAEFSVASVPTGNSACARDPCKGAGLPRFHVKPSNSLRRRFSAPLDANTSVQFETNQAGSHVSRETTRLLSVHSNSSATEFRNAIYSELYDRPALFHVKQQNLLLPPCHQTRKRRTRVNSPASTATEKDRHCGGVLASVFQAMPTCSCADPKPGAGRPDISRLSRPLPRRIVYFEYEKGSQIASSKRNQ